MRAMTLTGLLTLAITGCGRPQEATRAPAPPIGSGLPAELEATLPRTEAGLPILLASPSSGEAGVALALVYDSHLDDPVARWGQCLSRVAACYRTNSGSIAGCLELVEVCADDWGGEQCCPAGCLETFRSLRDSGLAEDTAIDRSYVKGDCISGFAAAFLAVGVEP